MKYYMMIDDKMTYNGVHSVSLTDNVWSPSDLPSGWEAQP